MAMMAGAAEDASYPDSLAALRELVKPADGIVLGTPEDQGSFSEVLKNALDLMGFEEFEGKPIRLVGVSGGQIGAFDALNSLRNVGQALRAWVIPEAGKVFSPDGSVRGVRIGGEIENRRPLSGAVCLAASLRATFRLRESLEEGAGKSRRLVTSTRFPLGFRHDSVRVSGRIRENPRYRTTGSTTACSGTRARGEDAQTEDRLLHPLKGYGSIGSPSSDRQSAWVAFR